ncbi:MAG TPA: hypothetical protein VK699_07580 [Terriglobales bacterium]|jgi:hypothetical protein|nr:hypothetical protein [Terriglobales bacterium]
MSDGTGQAPKKETVYGGSAPAMDNKAFAQPSGSTGTVYGGPTTTQGTVYGGPSAPGVASPPVRTATGVSPAVVRGASWFFWIAALSIVNSIISMSGGGWHFIVGMGITQVVDGIGSLTGSSGTAIAFVINLFIAGIVALFGVFARKGQKWAFLVGMILYALDGVLLLVASDFLSVAFHAYALFSIFRGFKSLD